MLDLVPNVLVTPVFITQTQGDTHPTFGYAPGKLIDGSGLSATPTAENWASVAHPWGGGATAWSTEAQGNPHYFSNASNPQPQFELDLGGSHRLTGLVIWGAEDLENEAALFEVSFSTDGGVTYVGSVTVTTGGHVGSASRLMRFPGGPHAADHVRLTITGNDKSVGYPAVSGGGGVSLTELRLLGKAAADTHRLSGLVVWGFGGSLDEASDFSLEFSTDSGIAYGSVVETVQTSSLLGMGNELLAFAAPRTANQVRLTVTENAQGRGWTGTGGGREGLGELRLVKMSVDTKAPGLATEVVAGDTLTLTYDEALDEDSTPAASAFTVTSDTNPAVTVTGVSVSGTMVVLTLSRVVAASETVTVSYTVPGTGSKLQDALGNPAANLSDRAVTNEVEVEPPAPEVIAPTAIAQTAGVRAETGYAASHLIDGSGLSESPTVDNLSSVTHADPTALANPNTGWRTAADGLVPNVLVTPVSITQTQGDAHPNYVPGNLIDGSGLSATPTAENWASVAHPWEGSTSAWSTAATGSPHYFSNTSNSQPQFELDLGVSRNLTGLVVWGANRSEAAGFEVRFSVDGGTTYGTAVTVTTDRFVGPANRHMVFPGGPHVADHVRLTITGTVSSLGYTSRAGGGDRVSLTELRFTGVSSVAPQTQFVLDLVPNVLVTPATITQTQGDTYSGYAPGNLIDGSGLSATPTAENWESVAHPWGGGQSAWSTNATGSPHYFSNSSNPQPQFELDLGGSHTLTGLVIWGAEDLENEAALFEVSFSTDGGVTYVGSVTVTTGRHVGSASRLMRFPGGPHAADHVRLTITGNDKSVGYSASSAGDRVSLTELRLLGKAAADTHRLSGLVVWGFGGSLDEASDFSLEFSTDSGIAYGSVVETVQTSSLLGMGNELLAFDAPRAANQVRLTVTENAQGRGWTGPGGGREGLGELRLVTMTPTLLPNIVAPVDVAQTQGGWAADYPPGYLIDGSGLSALPASVIELVNNTHTDPTASGVAKTGWWTPEYGRSTGAVVTPVSIRQTQGDAHPNYALGNLIDGSGLSAPPTAENWESVTHPWEGGLSAWSTNGSGRPHYFSNTSNSQPQFELDLGVSRNLTGLVVWGTSNGNEAARFEVSFSTDEGMNYSEPVTVATGSALQATSKHLTFPGGPFEADHVRLTVTANGKSLGYYNGGGDRVSMTELRFLEMPTTTITTNDYFDQNYPQPQLTFDLGQRHELRGLVVWGFGGSLDEASDFTVEFSTDGGKTYGSERESVRTSTVLGTDNELLAFNSSREADQVRVTVTGNGKSRGWAGTGGERVGLGEVRFQGKPVPVLIAASVSQTVLVDGSGDIDLSSLVTGIGSGTATYSVSSQPSNGTVMLNGVSATYTPTAGFTGTDSFVYQVMTGEERAVTGTVYVVVLDAQPAGTTIDAGDLTISLSPSGSVTALMGSDGNEYLAPGYTPALMKLIVADSPAAPAESAVELLPLFVTLADGVYRLFYDYGIKMTVALTEHAEYASLELTEVFNPDLKDIRVAMWGPYEATIDAQVADTAGVVYSRDFTIGIQGANEKTLGGAPYEYRRFDHSTNAYQAPMFRARHGASDYWKSAARLTSFGSVLQAYSRDHSEDRTRVVKSFFSLEQSNAGEARLWPRRVSALSGEHALADLAPLQGSKIALFGLRRSEAEGNGLNRRQVFKREILKVIETIEKEEGLPYATRSDGRWAKLAPDKQRVIGKGVAQTDFSTLAKDQVLAAGADSIYIWRRPAAHWDHVGLSYSPLGTVYGGSWTALETAVRSTQDLGVRHGTHILPGFAHITTNRTEFRPSTSPLERAVTTRPGDLAVFTTTTLAAAVDSTETDDIRFGGNHGVSLLRERGCCVWNYVLIGDELIGFQALEANSPHEWRLAGVHRGAFDTTRSDHQAGALVKILDNRYESYSSLFWGSNVAREAGRVLGDAMNRSGVDFVSLDGIESFAEGQHGVLPANAFIKAMYDNLNSKAVTSESSRIWHYNWHLHNRFMWGEFNSDVFEGTFDYQFSNIVYYQRNFIAPHIGGFFADANGSNEFHWIGSKIAAFDAGSLTRAGSSFANSKKAVLKAWIEATEAGAFSDWQRARLLPWERTFELVELEAGRLWRLKDRAVTLDYNASTKSRIAVDGYGTTSNPFQLARPWAGFPNRNVAGDALVTASSEPAGDAGFQPDNAVDGLIGYFDPPLYAGKGEVSEWHADASDAAPWIQLDWDSSQTVRAVLLYDRSDPGANVTNYRLDFSSGAPLTFCRGIARKRRLQGTRYRWWAEDDLAQDYDHWL